VGLRGLFGIAVTCACSGGAVPDSEWTLASSAHFKVYSQAGEAPARAALGWFEQLRAFFSGQMKLDLEKRPAVRVIGFRSTDRYRQYNTRPTSDAYYLGTESVDYIVMSKLTADQFGVAAHEYSHVVLHAGGLRLPSWLSEGLAEFLSSVRITGKSTTLGGDLPVRSRSLKRPWIPLAELLSITAESPLRNDRDGAALFYADSWALAHMLVLAPDYSPRFPRLVAALTSGTPGSEALTAVYGKPLNAIEHDAQQWIASRNFRPVAMPGISATPVAVEVTSVSAVDSQLLLGEVLFTSGESDRAETLYREIDRRTPGLPSVAAALGAIALRNGDREGARKQWRRAIDLGIHDASLCYRYAMLAQEAGLEAGEIRDALAQAIELQSDFDDARFTLGLLEMNKGRFEAAVEQFHAMKSIAPERAYGYWSALAYTLTELDLREPAKAAAAEAARYAATTEERTHVATLRTMAETDLAVRFTRDANGRAQLTTARAPHSQPNWNPFIEPGDRIRRVEATLDEIRCDGGLTRIAVIAGQSRMLLEIPDPSHVQMRNAPTEFICGRQPPRKVTVEYAASDAVQDSSGVVRGIEFQ
jgi:Flp pilus assembly protein TadD